MAFARGPAPSPEACWACSIATGSASTSGPRYSAVGGLGREPPCVTGGLLLFSDQARRCRWAFETCLAGLVRPLDAGKGERAAPSRSRANMRPCRVLCIRSASCKAHVRDCETRARSSDAGFSPATAPALRSCADGIMAAKNLRLFMRRLLAPPGAFIAKRSCLP